MTEDMAVADVVTRLREFVNHLDNLEIGARRVNLGRIESIAAGVEKDKKQTADLFTRLQRQIDGMQAQITALGSRLENEERVGRSLSETLQALKDGDLARLGYSVTRKAIDAVLYPKKKRRKPAIRKPRKSTPKQ